MSSPDIATAGSPADVGHVADVVRGRYRTAATLETAIPLPPSRRDAFGRRSLVIADLVAVWAAYGVVLLLAPPAGSTVARLALAGTLSAWIGLNKVLGLYDRDASVIRKSTLDELPRIFESAALGTAFIAVVAPIVTAVDLGRGDAVLLAGTLALLLPLLRVSARHASARSFGPERCVIVGSGPVAQLLARKLEAHPEYRLKVIGFVDHDAAPRPHDGARHLSDLDGLAPLCLAYGVERVVVAFSDASHEDLLDVLRTCKRIRVKVMLVPRLFEGHGEAIEIDHVEGMPLVGLRGLSRSRLSLALKRALDIAGAGAGLLVLAPLLATIAVAIKLTSPGRVLFRQERIGQEGRSFRMLKFRTMVPGADRRKADVAHLNEAVFPMFKIADDPRVTPLGRFLRRHSLDELPQLLNVLRGEMSLVGPRPLVPSESDHVLERYRSRLDLTPGLTGPWQVMGRTRVPFSEMVKLDSLYVAEWSLWTDIKLLLRTVPVVFRKHGL